MTLLPFATTVLLAPTGAQPAPALAPAEAPPAELVAVAPSAPPQVFSRPSYSDDGGARYVEPYVRVTGGAITAESSDAPDEDIDFEEGYLVSVAVGSRIGAAETGLGFGFEFEGLWTELDADDDGPIEAVTEVIAIGALVGGVVDYRIADAFALYASAGAGVAWLDVDTGADALHDFDDDDEASFVWQARAGIAWRLTSETALHVGYRYLAFDDVEIEDDVGAASFDLEVRQHGIEIGVVVGF
jgi:opacity protein-like surface antigen